MSHRHRGNFRVVPVEQKRVLLVDDNIDSADITALLLEHLGYDVLQIYDGQAALALAVDFEPDVVVLDIDMPGLNGLEVARALRALPPPLSRCRIVAISGHPHRTYEQAAPQAGFDDFFLKPVPLERWNEVIAPGQPKAVGGAAAGPRSADPRWRGGRRA